MPTITLNRKTFEKLVGKKLPPEQLKDRISMLGTDLEGVHENEIVVEVFPNRPDMLSEQGFARAFRSFIGVKSGLQAYKVKDSGKKIIVQNLPPEWPYAVAAIVKGLRLDSERIREIIQLQEKLATTHLRNRKKGGIGIYPLGNITFPVLFTGEQPDKILFQPLESPKAITGRQILLQHPTGKKYAHICAPWKTYPVFKDAAGKILSMPPIINSHDMGHVDESTKDVFIEATGTELHTLLVALNIFTTALADMGGEIYSLEIEYGKKKMKTPDLTPQKMALQKAYVQKLLGVQLDDAEIKKLLGRMGYGAEGKHVLVPAYRADILHPADLVEDIAIAYGYEHVAAEIPNVATIGQEDALETFSRALREILVGFGMLEIKNHHLFAKEELSAKMNVAEDRGGSVFLQSAPEENNHFRDWLLPGILKVLSKNQHHDYPQNIFELGTIARKDASTETGTKEFQHLCIALCHEKADFTDVKQAVEGLLRALGIAADFEEADQPLASFISGRVARVKQLKSAVLGEIHPQVLGKWKLTMPVAAFEVDVEELYGLIKESAAKTAKS